MDRAWIEVSLSSLKNNLKQIQSRIHSSKVMGVVKDEFYGLGHESVLALQEWGVDFFSVSNIEEAIKLRTYGIYQPILILGYTDPTRFPDLLTYSLQQTIVSTDYFKECVSFSKENSPLTCQLKINTGMNRLGVSYQDTDSIKAIMQSSDIIIQGIFTHLLASDEFNKEAREITLLQLSRYDEILRILKSENIPTGITHALNSYGCLFYGDHVYDYVRPGLCFAGCEDVQEFENVLKVKCKVSMVKKVLTGDQIGYGTVHKADKPMKIATITIGYGDGLLRSVSKTGFPVMLNNQECHFVGRICMDQCLIDVSHIPNVKQGDVVEIISDKHDIFELAKKLDTIPNEVLCQLNARLSKFIKD